ncbi:WW domain protein [Cooperia oncophora]
MVKEIKEFGPWSEQTSSSGRKYFYNRDTEVSQWEKPKEWREYELRLVEQERLTAEQERMQQQVQQQHSVVPPPPMFMTPPPFAFPPPFAPPGFPVGPMNAPPPPFPPYNQFQPPPNIPYPIPPRINSTISAPINTSFPPPPHPPAAPSPRVTQGLPPPLISPIVNVTSIPPAPHVGPIFSPIQYTTPPPGTGRCLSRSCEDHASHSRRTVGKLQGCCLVVYGAHRLSPKVGKMSIFLWNLCGSVLL